MSDNELVYPVVKKGRRVAGFRLLGGIAAVGLTTLSVGAETPDKTDNKALAESFARDSLIIDAGVACYRFDVYVATTNAQHRRGLMHVRQLPKFTGMLFVYPDAAVRSMWMKNTYIPLDMLFIRADGTVATIAADTEPLSLESIPSGEPVTYVLELNAGVSEELGIDTNSRVHIPPSLE